MAHFPLHITRCIYMLTVHTSRVESEGGESVDID